MPPEPLEDLQSQSEPKWQCLVDTSLQKRTLEAVHFLAERMREPERILALVEAAKPRDKSGFYWEAASFSSGFGSLILPYVYLARSFPDQGWDEVARQYTRLAVEGTHSHPFSQLGIFGGMSGLALAITLLSRQDTRYYNANKVFEKKIAALVLEHTWRRGTSGVADYDYDVISGAAGVLATLIALKSQEAITQNAIQKLLEYLVWLGLGEDEQKRKRWFIPPELFAAEYLPTMYPHGYFNIGLAHGIPGPLAALSLAWQAGYRIDGHREAMEAISRWLVNQQMRDRWGNNWPDGTAWQKDFLSLNQQRSFQGRAAWCYGPPGVARSLWLAGTVLNEKILCNTAIEAMEAALKRPTGIASLTSPTLCHGVSGLLIMCLRFAHETKNSTIMKYIPLLVNKILEACDPAYPLGVRGEDLQGKLVDNPGFLTGSAGVLLALLAAATSIEPAWDRALLIA